MDKSISFFIWAGHLSRIAKSVLYLPIDCGVLALSNLLLYYWAAVHVAVHWWFEQPRDIAAVTLEAALLAPMPPLEMCPSADRDLAMMLLSR